MGWALGSALGVVVPGSCKARPASLYRKAHVVGLRKARSPLLGVSGLAGPGGLPAMGGTPPDFRLPAGIGGTSWIVAASAACCLPTTSDLNVLGPPLVPSVQTWLETPLGAHQERQPQIRGRKA